VLDVPLLLPARVTVPWFDVHVSLVARATERRSAAAQIISSAEAVCAPVAVAVFGEEVPVDDPDESSGAAPRLPLYSLNCPAIRPEVMALIVGTASDPVAIL